MLCRLVSMVVIAFIVVGCSCRQSLEVCPPFSTNPLAMESPEGLANENSEATIDHEAEQLPDSGWGAPGAGITLQAESLDLLDSGFDSGRFVVRIGFLVIAVGQPGMRSIEYAEVHGIAGTVLAKPHKFFMISDANTLAGGDICFVFDVERCVCDRESGAAGGAMYPKILLISDQSQDNGRITYQCSILAAVCSSGELLEPSVRLLKRPDQEAVRMLRANLLSTRQSMDNEPLIEFSPRVVWDD